MNILMVNPNGGYKPTMHFSPLGLLSVATYLKEHGHRVRVYDRNVDKTPLAKLVQEFQPDVVGVSVVTRRHTNDGIVVSEWFRSKGVPIVWGGHMATIVPELVLEEGSADFVVLREGEVTFYELLQVLENKGGEEGFSQVLGLVYKDASGSICRTPERPFANLAEFPVTDWSLVDPQKYFAPQPCCANMVYVYCSKGCPYRCAFCYNKGYHRCQYRKRPVAHIMEEVRALAACGADGIEFADELFGVNKAELYELCDCIRALDTPIVWGFQTRVGHLSRSDYQYMYDSGCRWAFFGIESGSPEMNKRIHKQIDLTKVDLDFQYCREIGIYTYSAFIVGFPDETEEQLRDTAHLVLRLDADAVPMSMFYPNPGSELYDDLLAKGRVAPFTSLQQDSSFFPTTGLPDNFSAVPTRDLHVIQSYFNWRNFFRKSRFENNKHRRFAWKTIVTAIHQMRELGFLRMWEYAFSSAKLFITVAWYRFAYPGIRKKYGLTAKDKKGVN